jgi:hypothetical protein
VSFEINRKTKGEGDMPIKISTRFDVFYLSHSFSLF